VNLFFFFFLVTRHSFNQQESQRPYNKSKGEGGGGSFPLQMGEEGGGKVSENAVREDSCCGPIRLTMGAKVCISVYFFFASQREAISNMDKVLAIIESICQSKVMDGKVSAAMMILESPSREKDFNCKEVAREAASLATRASPKVGSQGGLT
jgi:hypothetical protein